MTESSRPIYQNNWISVREDIARMPDGRTTIYGVVTTARSVGVLGFVDPDHVVMVQQWRYVPAKPMWEMPTGAAHDDEDLADAAAREFAEESGFVAGSLRRLTSFVSSKSILDETNHLFVATDLAVGTAQPDPTEFLRVEVLPWTTVLNMVLSGEITDSMTIVAVLLVERERQAARR